MARRSSPPRATAAENSPKTSRYRAPALEKGLDVIELLAAEKKPLNLSAISQRLGRSSGELFRMLQVLEFKGFITTTESGTGYVLTNKLFALAMAQAPVRSLVETALPIMRKLTDDIGQSCHIAVASEDQIVVITRIERPGDLASAIAVKSRARPRAWCCSPIRRMRRVASGSSAAGSRAKRRFPSWSARMRCAGAATTKPRRISYAASSTCRRPSCAAKWPWRR
jgi:Mn-dependent DtxR family transcriptional regulator